MSPLLTCILLAALAPGLRPPEAGPISPRLPCLVVHLRGAESVDGRFDVAASVSFACGTTDEPAVARLVVDGRTRALTLVSRHASARMHAVIDRPAEPVLACVEVEAGGSPKLVSRACDRIGLPEAEPALPLTTREPRRLR